MSVDVALKQLSEALLERVDETVTLIMRRDLEVIPNWQLALTPEVEESYRRACFAQLTWVFDQLGRGRELPTQIPPTAAEEARTNAQAGIKLEVMVRAYRLSQATTWEVITEVAEEVVPESQTRIEVLKIASRYCFAYMDAVCELLAPIYQQERDRLFRGRDRRKLEIIRDVLAGLAVDTDLLSYDLAAAHLGVVAWGPGREQAVAELAAAMDGRLLAPAGPGETLNGWIALPALGWPVDEALAALPVDRAVRLAVGEPAAGVAGFRLTHRQAVEAYRLARRIDAGPATRYANVALEALATSDLDAARAFVEHFLGPLMTDDERTLILRETLAAYFAANHNALAAAARLNVNDRTVAYRLRTIEERLGAEIATRRDELGVALRVLAMLERHQHRQVELARPAPDLFVEEGV